MGYLAVCPIMAGKRAFYPNATGKLSHQRTIEDNMIAHHKRVYSAKAVVDCSVPKSMRCDVKYLDQMRHEQKKKHMSERAQSVRSLSQRSLKLDNIISCSSRNVRPSARSAESACFNTGGFSMSSPRFSTSFHCKQIVYPSQMATQSQYKCRPSSDLGYKSSKSQRHHFALSSATSSSPEQFKSFQDPAQKTYSGDILFKHAHCFTQEKPFTPRTLKKDCKSSLSTYRYYTPASRKGAKELTLSKYHQPEMQQRSKQKSSTPPDSPQQCSLDHEWSDEESNVFEQGTSNKYRPSDFFLSSSRVSPEGMRSPIMRKVTAEEEELMYLQFITDITNELVLRGLYSDRVLERVFERHIDMNKHRLSRDKMLCLLEDLKNDLQKPFSSSIMVIEKKERDCSLLHRYSDSSLQPNLEHLVTNDTSFPFGTPLGDKDRWGHDGFTHELDTTSVNDKSVQQEDKALMDLDQNHKNENAVSPSLEDVKDQSCVDNDDLDELGRNMAASLNVSEFHSSQELTERESSVKLSDEEF